MSTAEHWEDTLDGIAREVRNLPGWPKRWADWLPDLEDPGTGGQMLAMLQSSELGLELHHEPDCGVIQVWLWREVTSYSHCAERVAYGEGATLAEACAACALDLGRWPGGE
jgi:hypothetical protein